jgi:biotin transport system substrate-specific component
MKTKDMILVAIFAALMVVGAYIKVLIPVIPMSFQPFFCALAGILLGAKLGALSQVVYLFIGLTGLPVFTQGGGPMYVLKPSFGFLLGFILAAYVIGKVSEKLQAVNFLNMVLSVFPGLIALYAVGLPYMYIILKFYIKMESLDLTKLLSLGFFPFIIKDIVLYFLISIVLCKVIPALRKTHLISTVK